MAIWQYGNRTCYDCTHTHTLTHSQCITFVQFKNYYDDFTASDKRLTDKFLKNEKEFERDLFGNNGSPLGTCVMTDAIMDVIEEIFDSDQYNAIRLTILDILGYFDDCNTSQNSICKLHNIPKLKEDNSSNSQELLAVSGILILKYFRGVLVIPIGVSADRTIKIGLSPFYAEALDESPMHQGKSKLLRMMAKPNLGFMRPKHIDLWDWKNKRFTPAWQHITRRLNNYSNMTSFYHVINLLQSCYRLATYKHKKDDDKTIMQTSKKLQNILNL